LPITDNLSCMLPKLHAFNMLFYAESVSVVTSGHVTKIAVKPFDLQNCKSNLHETFIKDVSVEYKKEHTITFWKSSGGLLSCC